MAPAECTVRLRTKRVLVININTHTYTSIQTYTNYINVHVHVLQSFFDHLIYSNTIQYHFGNTCTCCYRKYK